MVQGTTPAYWYVTRSPSTRKGDDGTDVFLSLVDLSARPMQLDYDTVTVRSTCTNRDLVTRLPFGSETGDFEMTGGCRDQAHRRAAQADSDPAPSAGWKDPVVPDLAPVAELSFHCG